MLFLSEHGITYQYQDLINTLNLRLNGSDINTPYNYFEFVVYILAGILSDQEHIISQDFTQDSTVWNDTNSHSKVEIKDIDHLIEKVKTSISNIGIYSSGTEGTQKLIYQPLSRLLKSVKIIPTYVQSRWALTYNPAHSAGIQLLLQVLINKASIVYMYKESRERIINSLINNNIHYLAATPTFYRMLAPYDFQVPTIKSLTFNGEKSSKFLIDEVKKSFPNAAIRNIYGSTESGPLMSSDTTSFVIPDRIKEKVKIVNAELWLHHTIVSKNAKTHDDWYPTGDLVNIEDEDPLTISFVSRKSRIINVGGHNVNPQEVEECLLEHKDIKEVMVVGRPHKIIGNVIVAHVVLHNQISEAQILEYCKQKLSLYKCPKVVYFAEAIKSTYSGKKHISE